MEKIELKAEPRSVTGKKVKRLRKEGLLPAVLYGRGFDSLNIQVPLKEFEAVYSEAGETTLVYVEVEKESHPTILKHVSINPLTDVATHVDFYKVRLDEAIVARIPLVFVNEAPAVKNFSGVIVRNMQELEVKGLPQNLPHEIEIDLSTLEEIGNKIVVSDLAVGSDIEVLASGKDIVVLIQEQSQEDLSEPVEGGQYRRC